MRDSIILAALSISGVVTIAACRGASDDGAAGSPSDLIVSDNLVIRQIYGGGGNTAAPFKYDFVELFNRGAEPVSLADKSLQYAKADGDFSATATVVALPADVMLQPGQSFLVKMKSSGEIGAELGATADLSPALPLSIGSVSGKVAIAPSNALLDACGSAATPCAADKYIDLIGYGTVTQAEGTALGALSNTTGALRKNNGCADTGNNAADFEIAAPSFRNAASAATPCDPDAGPAPDAAPPPSGDGGVEGSDDDAAAASDAAASDGAVATDAGTDAAPPLGASLVLLNEIKINPPGNTDTPWEYAEIACPPNGSLVGYYFVAIEGDGDSSTGSPGVADIVVDLGAQKCGSNGIAVVKAEAGGHTFGAQATLFTTASLDTGSGFENATTSFAIVRSPNAPIVQGADYDVANDGTLTLPNGASIVDGVSVFEQTNGVADYTYVPRLAKAGITADAASRLPGQTTPLSESAWYFGDLSGANGDSLKYDPAKASANLPANAALTPGVSNVGTPAPAPGPSGGGDDDPVTPVGGGDEDPGGDEPSGSGSPTGDTTKPSGRGAPLPAGPATNSSASCAAAPAPASSMAGLAGMLVALVTLASRRKRSR